MIYQYMGEYAYYMTLRVEYMPIFTTVAENDYRENPKRRCIYQYMQCFSATLFSDFFSLGDYPAFWFFYRNCR